MKSLTNLKILVAEKSSFSERGLSALAEIAPTDALDVCQPDLAKITAGYSILLVRLGLRVDKQVLSASRKLLVVGTPTTGLDHVDLESATERGVAVLSLKGEREFLDQVYGTAEHTFALLLSLLRNIPGAYDSVKRGEWRRDKLRGYELNGKTLGIVGFGRLGSMTAGYARAFGMRVLVYDPYQPKLPDDVTGCLTLVDLLSQSDVVTIHVVLNEETQGLFGEEQFAAFKPGSYLVNTSRGAIIDEVALLGALESGKLAGATLDVLCCEDTLCRGGRNPLIEYACTHENLIITPHIGGATYESVEKADLYIAGKIRQYLEAMHVGPV